MTLLQTGEPGESPTATVAGPCNAGTTGYRGHEAMGRLVHKTLGRIKILGFSLAGEETVVAVPEYNVCFDIGRAPREVISIDNVCLSHGHMDHAAGVAYWQTLGISVESVEVGHVLLGLPMSPALGTRRTDVMHGGAIASLIDATAGASTATLRRDDDESWTGQATLDLNVTFLAAATSDVVAEGRVLRSSRAFSFVSVDVRDAEGTLVSTGRATYTIIRKR